jgi:carbon monoxide dehydrogenase subunit G
MGGDGNSTIGAAVHDRPVAAAERVRVLSRHRNIQLNISSAAEAALPSLARIGDGPASRASRNLGRETCDNLIFAARCEKLSDKRMGSCIAPRGRHIGGRIKSARKETSMPMTMTGDVTLPADRPKVWGLLNDPQVLKACIPGCESLEKTGDNGFAAVVKTKIGPVSATFKGKVELSDLVPLVGYTIKGEGEGGIAGFAKGGAKVSLADAPGGTLMHYDVEAHVGGKIAQLGARLIDGVAKSMADKFFASFAAIAAQGAAPAAAAEAAAPSPAAAAPPVGSPAARVSPSAPPGASSRPPAQAVPANTSWFRRITEWFMSLWR